MVPEQQPGRRGVWLSRVLRRFVLREFRILGIIVLRFHGVFDRERRRIFGKRKNKIIGGSILLTALSAPGR